MWECRPSVVTSRELDWFPTRDPRRAASRSSQWAEGGDPPGQGLPWGWVSLVRLNQPLDRCHVPIGTSRRSRTAHGILVYLGSANAVLGRPLPTALRFSLRAMAMACLGFFTIGPFLLPL